MFDQVQLFNCLELWLSSIEFDWNSVRLGSIDYVGYTYMKENYNNTKLKCKGI